MINDSFTTCIFLNTKSEYDVYRYNNILYPSLMFLTNKVLIIPHFRNDLKLDDSYKILYDKDVLGVDYSPIYIKQHLLKLYVSKFISTNYYLILDSDIYINKTFELKDFFTDGKISLFVYDGIGYLNDKVNHDSCHTKWIIETLNVLGKTVDQIKSPFCYGVTPGLFITKEVIELLELLNLKYNNFVKFFMENPFGMEYSYYYIHVYGKNLYCLDYSKKFVSAVWSPDDSILKLDKDSIFWVIQSNTKIDNKTLEDFIFKKCLNQL
jgi:hypothetical protein